MEIKIVIMIVGYWIVNCLMERKVTKNRAAGRMESQVVGILFSERQTLMAEYRTLFAVFFYIIRLNSALPSVVLEFW